MVAVRTMASNEKPERKDPTMEVEAGEARPQDSLERMLDELEVEVEEVAPPPKRPKSSIPPPLPARRSPSQRPSPRPPTGRTGIPPRASAPPPPPRKAAPPIGIPAIAREDSGATPRSRVKGL